MEHSFMNYSLLHLSLIPEIGAGKLEQLITQISVKEEDLYRFTQKDFEHYGFSALIAQKLVTGLQDKSLLEKELELIERHNFSWCTIIDTEYPTLLKEIHLPPLVLFYQGDFAF